MAIWHLVAKTARSRVDLTDWELAARVWGVLRRAFPGALAAGLMPDHVHVIDESLAAHEARRAMGHAVSRATYGMGKGVWQAVPEPDRVRESKLERAMRYVALNPCRAQLAPDPLEWVWSTHREVMGAVVDPWTDADRIAVRLGPGRWRSADDWHRYVSSDFTVSPGGTPVPGAVTAAEPSRSATVLPTHTLGRIADAVAAAMRCRRANIRRRGVARALFVALARRQGWSDRARLAEMCGTSRRAVDLAADRGVDPGAFRAAILCLSDSRLLIPEPSGSEFRLHRKLEGDGRPSGWKLL